MHFQYQRGFAGYAASKIRERSLVGGSHFAQSRSARFEYFRDPEPAADLNQFAPRNHDLIFSRCVLAPPAPARDCNASGFISAEMAKDQDESARVVIHHRGGFRVAEQRENVFQVRGATASTAMGDSIFEIVVLRADPAYRVHQGSS